MTHADKTPHEAHALVTGPEKWTYLDVRTAEEFASGHPSGAFNVPLFFRGALGMQPNPEFADVVKRRFPASTKLVVGCAAGGRSSKACAELARLGYTNLVNVLGGFGGGSDASGRPIAGWQASKLPVAKAPEPGRSWLELSKR